MTSFLAQVILPLKKGAYFTKVLLLLIVFSLLLACPDEELAQIPPVGDLDGYLCEPQSNQLARQATVIGEGPEGPAASTTDDRGYFILRNLFAGPQNLTVEGPNFEMAVAVEVEADTLTRLPDPPCLSQEVGKLEGRICASEAGLGTSGVYWVFGARVYIEWGETTFETTTDVEGRFSLENIPVGTHTLRVHKGSFFATASVEVSANETTVVEPLCFEPEIQMGVITGIYDQVETLLQDLGYGVASCLPADLANCPTLSNDGTITLIDGLSSYFITELLNDPTALSQFEILFFNCGLADQFLRSSPPEVGEALREYVRNGGSLYISDWAYEIARVFFSGTLSFWGDDSEPEQAKEGAIDENLNARVEVDDLVQVLGETSIGMNFNKGNWVLLEPTQGAEVLVWMTGNGVSHGASGGIAEEIPLLVSVPYGDGKLVFTSFHSHEQASAQMMAILKFLVFEL